MPAKTKYALADIESNVGRSYDLSNLLVRELLEMSPRDGDQVDPIVSLAWVLRDLLERIKKDFELGGLAVPR